MTRLAKVLALGAVVAAPAAAQYNPYSNQPGYNYPTYPGQAYPGYGYNQGYTGNPVTDIIDQLLGNRYNVTDRQAVRQCARAATAQAQNQYGGGYGNRYGYNQGFAPPSLHVTAITDVERRSNGLRVRGVLSSGYQGQYGNGYQGYGNAYGNGYQGYGNAYGNRGYGDLTFRCSVDYRGVVTDVRVGPNGYRRD
jgi:hypothetical protein